MHSTLIETEQLAERLGDPKIAVLDCRFDLGHPSAGRTAWQAGHIPGAQYVDLNQDMSSVPDEHSGRHPLPDVGGFEAFLGDMGITPDTQIVVYDDAGGAIAGRMWWLMRWVGHSCVALLNGGWDRWTEEGRPVTNEPSSRPETRYAANVQNDLWVTTETVVRELGARRIQLIDARAPNRFAGREEPLDPVAGHIPGARNIPFQENLNEDGRFKSPEELRQRFATSPDALPACHSCGSGVTACHNFLAMVHAGLEPGQLYVGSWSEWIRDPNRPVATGDD